MRNFVVANGLADLAESEHGLYATALTWTSFSRGRDPLTRKIQKRLEQWRDRHQISPRDIWIMDAALQTIGFAALREKRLPDQWVYFPAEQVWPRFVPKLKNATWHRNEEESWPVFAKRMHAQFRTQLNLYRQMMKSMSFFEDIKEEEKRDAQWLAQYVSGESWDQIAAKVEDRFSEPKSSVRNNSMRLARRIGLTLPRRSAGRRRHS